MSAYGALLFHWMPEQVRHDGISLDWIPGLGFGFLRRPTDYIPVVEVRDGEPVITRQFQKRLSGEYI